MKSDLEYDVKLIKGIVLLLKDEFFTDKKYRKPPPMCDTKSIESSLYYDVNLKQCDIPKTVEIIKGYAFTHGKFRCLKLPSAVSFIGDFAFACGRVKYLSLPDNLSTLGNGAFSYNTIRSLTLPSSLEHVPKSAFEGNRIRKLQLGNHVTLGPYCFASNDFRKVKIPSSVRFIDTGGFDDNPRLRCIEIGENVCLRKNSFPFNFCEYYNNTNKRSGLYHLERGSSIKVENAQNWSWQENS